MCPIGYIYVLKYTLQSTKQYDRWFYKLKDSRTKTRVLARLNRVENGNFGDAKQIGLSLFELRLFFAAGYRIYYTIQKSKVVLLLAAGDKSSQKKDIEIATQLINKLKD